MAASSASKKSKSGSRAQFFLFKLLNDADPDKICKYRSTNKVVKIQKTSFWSYKHFLQILKSNARETAQKIKNLIL